MNKILSEKSKALKLFDKGHFEAAIRLMLPLAELGDVEVQAALGAIYQCGSCQLPRDLEKAVYWLEKAAGGGSGLAAWNLGTLYMTCEPDLPIDPEKSEYWRSKSKKLGIAPFRMSTGNLTE